MTAVEHSTDHAVYGMPRADWLAARRKGIGGSDAAALVGCDPFRSAFTVFLDKTGYALDDDPNEAMEWGNLLEPVIAHVWERRHGRRLMRPASMLTHPQYEWMLASVDRFVIGDDGNEEACWEGKTTNAWADKDWDFDSGVIPEHVIIQATHYLAVTDLPRCEVAVLIGGQQLRSCTVERDDNLIANLIEVERRFWEDHVLANKPPPLDGHRSTTESVKALFPESEHDAEVDLPYDANALIVAHREAEERLRLAKDDKDAAANQLRVLLGGAEVGRIDGMRAVTWKSQTSDSLDRKALRAAHPQLCEEYTVQSATRVLRLVKSYVP